LFVYSVTRVYAGDPVWPCTPTMVQDQSGWAMCSVVAMSCHWQNVDMVAGAFTAVNTTRTYQLPVTTVSACWHILSAVST